MIKSLFSGLFGFLTILLILFFLLVIQFNIAPITYVVFIVFILLSLYLQYRSKYLKAMSSRRFHCYSWSLVLSFCVCFSGLVIDWMKYDVGQAIDEATKIEYSNELWSLGWPNNDELPVELHEPMLPKEIYHISSVRSDVVWANAYPWRYVVLEGEPEIIAQYEAVGKKYASYQAYIDQYGVLREVNSNEIKRYISHPSGYDIINSIYEEPLNLPPQSFVEWLRFAPRKETKTVIKCSHQSTNNHRLYVFVDDGNTKRPHYIALLVNDSGTKAILYQSK